MHLGGNRVSENSISRQLVNRGIEGLAIQHAPRSCHAQVIGLEDNFIRGWSPPKKGCNATLVRNSDSVKQLDREVR
jgi:hypothetical protein